MSIFDRFFKKCRTERPYNLKEKAGQLLSSHRKSTTQLQLQLDAEQLLNQAHASADVANNTSNPEIFFSAYEDTIHAMRKLASMESIISFKGRSPSTILIELESQGKREAAIAAMVDRCIETCRWQSSQEAEEELSLYLDKIPQIVQDRIVNLSAVLKKTSQFSIEEYNRANEQQIAAFKKAFDLRTIAGIQSITYDAVKPWIQSAPGVPSHPVEILSKQASAYKKENIDLAVECLRKANELRPVSGMLYPEDSYLRLVRYLRKAERFSEADMEEKKIQDMFHGASAPYSRETIANSALKQSFLNAEKIGTDLVEVSWTSVCCEICGKYRGRIFSISGRDKRFPKFPDDFCLCCGLSAYPIIEGVSVPLYSDPDHIVEEAQRPFIDTRTPDEIKAYADKCRKIQSDKKDREDYVWIQKNLPELAPKSFSGYRRMKNMNSINFQKLKSNALELGRKI